MHDVGVRILSAVLCSGVILFLACQMWCRFRPIQYAAAVRQPAPRYGVLSPVARPLEWTVREVEGRATHNWGWSIVATTFLINLLLLPFRILAAKGSKAMRALQPKLEGVKDPQKLQELYREHKVNPLGGCIPALAPFAILAAFYAVIRGLTELRGAHWLWIADLSRPEDLPLRILPLVMIATQLLLGKLTPPAPGADPKMQRLLNLMPLIFGAALYGQPSALMLYWVTSNLLGLAQQWWIGKRYA